MPPNHASNLPQPGQGRDSSLAMDQEKETTGEDGEELEYPRDMTAPHEVIDNTDSAEGSHDDEAFDEIIARDTPHQHSSGRIPIHANV